MIDSQRRLQQNVKTVEAQKGQSEHMLREVEQASRVRSEFLANMSDEISHSHERHCGNDIISARNGADARSAPIS